MKLPDIKFFKTGATSDGGTPGAFDSGRYRSGTEMFNKKNAIAPAPASITGVVINYASVANIDGNGILTYTNATKELQWTPPGGTIGAPVAFSANATKILYGNDISNYIEVTVTYASLPAGNATDSIAINKKKPSAPTNTTGVRINWASLRNANGAGTLTFTKATNTLQWTPPGGTIGVGVVFTTNGTAILEGGDNIEKSIEITVTFASLPAANTTDSIVVSSISGSLLNNVFDDVTSTEASAGDTEYRAIAMKNTHDIESGVSPKVWLVPISGNPTPASGDTWEIAIEAPSSQPAGFAQTIATEDTAPTGLTFSAPLTEAAAIVIPINLAPGQIYFIWRKRIVSAGAAPYADNYAQLAFSCDINNLEN